MEGGGGMTSRQVGKRISTLSKRRTRVSRQAVGQRQTSMTAVERRRLTQLVVSAVAFITLVGVKLLLPGRLAAVGDTLSQAMSRNMDVTQVFSAVGRAISGEGGDPLGEVYQAVFHPSEEETSIPVDGETSAAVLAPLRDYADGRGDASGWLPAPNAAGEALEVSLPQETEAAEAQEAVPAISPEAEDPGNVFYGGENLPDHVSMEQAVLGFDYSTPVKGGTLSSGFGYREHPTEGEERFHYGLDIAADSGAAIRCFADGKVTAVGESSSYGKYCVVSHDNGCSTLYAHCSKITASSGTEVGEGDKIAEVGETGMATGPHLHFELQKNGDYLNPIYYVSLA